MFTLPDPEPTPFGTKLKENSHPDVMEHTKNVVTNQILVREAFIFISTKNQIWDIDIFSCVCQAGFIITLSF